MNSSKPIPPPLRRWGQNHLLEPSVLSKMIRGMDVHPDDTFLEIGPGTGTLTRQLAPLVGSLLAIEIDERMQAHLQVVADEFPQVQYLMEDFLAWQPEPFSNRVRVVGNIPYNITSQIVLHLFQLRQYFIDAHLLMQKEVAQRLLAGPGTRTYGTLSVYTGLFCKGRYLFDVSRNVFRPRPKVDSAFVSLAFDHSLDLSDHEEEHLHKIVRLAFNQRRKTLRNSLRSYLEPAGAKPDWLDLELRAEQLAPQDYLKLAEYFSGRDPD